MDENKENSKLKEGWWKPAVEIFIQVSTWIAIPIIISLIVGKKLDNHFDTKPWIFLGLAGFSFIISCYGIYRVINKYMQKIKNLGNIESNKNN